MAGCPGALSDPDRFVEGGSSTCPPGTDVEKDIFGTSCSSKLCHDSDQPAAGLDLTANVASQVVGVTSSGGEECDGQLLLDPNDPEGSLFLEKVAAKTPRCGDRMPLGVPLSAGEIDCVRQWVKQVSGGAGGGGGAPSDAGGDQ